MTNIEEIWKDIPTFEGVYKASNLGRVKRVSSTILTKKGNQKLIKENISDGSMNVHGYKQISLSHLGTKYKFILHRLIAQTFIPNPDNKRTVNHINGIKTDNRIENLEWATDSENNLHSFKELGRVSGRKGKSPYQPTRWKAIFCFSNGKTYDNAELASIDLNIRASTIRQSINRYKGEYKGKMMFSYA